MKSLWKKFIDWLMPKKRNEKKLSIVEYSPKPKNPKEPPRLTDDDRLEQHINLDLSHSVERGETTLLNLAEKNSRTEGSTLDQAARLLNSVHRSGKNTITTTRLHTLDEGIISLKQDKMQKLIDQKKNHKPFYKDDNKKDWE